MKKRELQLAGCLVPDTVSQAAGLYDVRDMTGTKEEITQRLQDMVKRNGTENTYFDFYYGTLSGEEQQKIHSFLNAEEVSFLQKLCLPQSREEVYFSYDRMLFSIALKLSLNGCLFSTFYFSATKETVWSNYDCRFLVFSSKMIKPQRLRRGDRVAIVSLSWGGLGDLETIHKFHIAKERLEKDFGLHVTVMPHALKGTDFVAEHPELRAKDLMDAFEDKTISAIFCAIGGDDSIRLLPYINYDIIKNNPKIFMGYSDSTINHFMMYKAGLVSFYGPSIMCEFGEYVKMFDYTKKAVEDVLFHDTAGYRIQSSEEWSSDYIYWKEENQHIQPTLRREEHGYEVLQGNGCVRGHLLGGCIDVFMMANGTEIWPGLEKWENAILFFETSEDKPSPEFIIYSLRNLAAQGILKLLKGIVVGKPQGEVHYESYKEAILQVVAKEEHLVRLPIFYNVNFGHAKPIGILPYGIKAELNCAEKSITLLESATVSFIDKERQKYD